MYLFLNTDHHLSIQAKAKHEMLANLVLPTFVEEFSRPPKLERRNTFAFQASVMRSKKDGKFINCCHFGFQRSNLRFLAYNCTTWPPSYRFHELASFFDEFSALKFPHCLELILELRSRATRTGRENVRKGREFVEC